MPAVAEIAFLLVEKRKAGAMPGLNVGSVDRGVHREGTMPAPTGPVK